MKDLAERYAVQSKIMFEGARHWLDEERKKMINEHDIKDMWPEGSSTSSIMKRAWEANKPKEPPPGSKYDGEKPRMDLLDADFLEGVAEVLTFGARKYAAHNWRGGIHYSRLIAALYRHLGAINRGPH